MNTMLPLAGGQVFYHGMALVHAAAIPLAPALLAAAAVAAAVLLRWRRARR